MTMLYLVLGTVFGFALSRSGAADYNYIQGMFLFERFQLYGVLATGVLFTAPGLWLLKERARTITGAPLSDRTQVDEPRHRRWQPAVRCRLVDHRHVPGADSRQHRRGEGVHACGTRGSACRRRPVRSGIRLVQEAIRIAAIEAAGKGDGLIRGCALAVPRFSSRRANSGSSVHLQRLCRYSCPSVELRRPPESRRPPDRSEPRRKVLRTGGPSIQPDARPAFRISQPITHARARAGHIGPSPTRRADRRDRRDRHRQDDAVPIDAGELRVEDVSVGDSRSGARGGGPAAPGADRFRHHQRHRRTGRGPDVRGDTAPVRLDAAAVSRIADSAAGARGDHDRRSAAAESARARGNSPAVELRDRRGRSCCRSCSSASPNSTNCCGSRTCGS